MPNVNDIIAVAEAMEKSPVAIVADRCVAVRNRNAKCRRCVHACPKSAIEVSANEVHLSVSACIACGACAAACPTEALVPVAPADADLAAAAASAMAANGGRAVFACARIASKRLADPASFAEVPCLPRVDEVLAVSLVSQGACDVLLVDGNCSTCKHGACSALTDAAASCANVLLAAQGSPVSVRRATGFPEDMLVGFPAQETGTSRRDFFSEARRSAKETAMTAARTKIEQELGKRPQPGIGDRLRVTEGGTLPQITAPRHEAAMNALDAIGAPVAETLESRLFGSVTVSPAACNACGMCAVFCPTGALRRDPSEKAGDPVRYLEFSACDCVQCGMCADVCWKGALELSPSVSTAELFDFEPVTFHVARKRTPKR